MSNGVDSAIIYVGFYVELIKTLSEECYDQIGLHLNNKATCKHIKNKNKTKQKKQTNKQTDTQANKDNIGVS